MHPKGYEYLHEFRLDPFPVFLYRVAGLELEKRVFLVHGENSVVVEYELRNTESDGLGDIALEVRPLIAFRDYHSTTHRNDGLDPHVEEAGSVARIAPYPDLPPLFFSHDAAALDRTGDWYFNFEYGVERERGLDFQEDLFSPLCCDFRSASEAGRRLSPRPGRTILAAHPNCGSGKWPVGKRTSMPRLAANRSSRLW